MSPLHQMARVLEIGAKLMDDSIASARREEAIERAEVAAHLGMQRPTEIFNAINKLKDEMTALCVKHGTDPLDVACMIENLTEWHHAIERDVRRGCFTGGLEWMA
jgi:hypothetical protein